MVPFWDFEFDHQGNPLPYDGPDYLEEEWDTCWLNGVQLPGHVTVNCPTKQKVDVRKKNGADGGPTIERGMEAAKVEIVVRMWKPSQWRIFQEVMGVLWRQPNKDSKQDRAAQSGTGTKAKAGIAIHSAATSAPMTKVMAIVIEEVGSVQISGGVGEVAIKAIQYIPPSKKPATRKVQGSGVPLAPEVEAAARAGRNSVGKPPHVTDAKPALLFTPASGQF